MITLVLMMITCSDGHCYKNYRFNLEVNNITSLTPISVQLCETKQYEFPVRTLFNCTPEIVCLVHSKDEDGTDKRIVVGKCSQIAKYRKDLYEQK